MRLKIITPLGEFFSDHNEYTKEEFEKLKDACARFLTAKDTMDYVSLDIMGNGDILFLPADVIKKSVFLIEK